ncbi:tyrosine-type recombinase/integrase [Paraburkholderia youngii]
MWRSTAKTMRAWLKVNPEFLPTSPLFPNRRGYAMTRANVALRLTLAIGHATGTCPSLAEPHVSPHIIRRITAMHLLQAGVDISVIALWLGHGSPITTHHYVEADLNMKERALARLHEPQTSIQRYRAPDSLIKFLKAM